ncbi:MAG TPA: SatD family protein [Terriglobales bacterium]|nr:SatD family protein [Terriglobales bacterium]
MRSGEASGCIAVIADMVHSRELNAHQRRTAQLDFATFLKNINVDFRKAVLARFVITLGDECQGILHDATALPDLLWRFDEFENRQLRVGIGSGVLYTPVGRDAINIDGPALHRARAAIERAKEDRLLGGVFEGFGKDHDAVFNGFARLLHHHRSNLSEQQHEVVAHLRSGLNQTQTAEKMGITRQAVSLYASRAGWEAYDEGEQAFKTACAVIHPTQNER